MDGTHVSDVHAAASERFADRRLWYSGSDQEALQKAQDAQAGADGENCEGLGALPVGRLLVSVAKPGYQDDVELRFPVQWRRPAPLLSIVVLHDLSTLHYKLHSLQRSHILQGIAVDGNDVRPLAGLNCADLV